MIHRMDHISKIYCMFYHKSFYKNCRVKISDLFRTNVISCMISATIFLENSINFSFGFTGTKGLSSSISATERDNDKQKIPHNMSYLNQIHTKYFRNISNIKLNPKIFSHYTLAGTPGMSVRIYDNPNTGNLFPTSSRKSHKTFKSVYKGFFEC